MNTLEIPFQSIVDDDPKAIWVVDRQGNTAYGNQAFQTLFCEDGQSPCHIYIQEAFSSDFIKVWKALLDNGGMKTFSSEKTIQKVVAELKVQAYAVGVGKSRQVVFQFIQATTIFQKDGFLQTLIDLFPDVVYYKDLKSRFILSNEANNKKMQALHPGVDIIGKTDFDLFSHENAKAAFDEEVEIIVTANSKLNYVKKEIWSDGTVTWSSNSKMPLYDGSGKIIGTFGIGKDITKEKNKELEIEKLNSDLDNQVHLLKAMNHELKTFSYSVSHDLRAPLRAINGFSKIILEDFGAEFDDEAKRLFGIIIDNSRKMNLLINDLLSYSKLNEQTKRFVILDPTPMISEIVLELGLNESHLKVGNLVELYADRVLIKQVFSNLIGNAFKFSAQNSDWEIELGASESDSHTEFYVKDNGVGFDMAYYDKVFGIFQRLHTDAEFEGTGIGLAIVHKIILSHGGKIWATSELNKGSTFYFSIPKASIANL